MVLYGAYEEMVRVLIEDGADLDARTFDNETPLELALIKGNAGVKRIIEEELIRKERIRQNSAS
jgi:ankyrin repeat protein